MNSVKLPNYLKNRVRKYLSYIWDSDHQLDLSLITGNLSESLKYEFTIQVNGTILANFASFCEIFTRKLLTDLTQIFSE